MAVVAGGTARSSSAPERLGLGQSPEIGPDGWVPGWTGARRPAASAAEAGRGRSARRPVGAVDHGVEPEREAAGSGAAAGTGGRPGAGAAVRADEPRGTAGRP